MKLFTYIAGLLGLAVAIALVIREGWTPVSHVLGQAGWGLLWLVPFHAIPLWLDTMGWRLLIAPRDPQERARTPYLFWVACVREAVNRLLPTANVGGEIVGIRLPIMRGLPGAAVAASVIVEVSLTFVNQYLLTATGLVLMVSVMGATQLAETITLGLALSLPVPIALFLLLRYGSIFERLERVVERMLGADSQFAAMFDGASLDGEIKALYKHRGRLLGATAWQFAGYTIGAFETWLALHLLGHEVTPWAAFALEATTQAVRHFIFIVPAGLGVQEAGLVIFGNLLGLPTDVAIALSLAKRMREVLFGVPALLSWQWIESARLRAMFGAGRAKNSASS